MSDVKKGLQRAKPSPNPVANLAYASEVIHRARLTLDLVQTERREQATLTALFEPVNQGGGEDFHPSVGFGARERAVRQHIPTAVEQDELAMYGGRAIHPQLERIRQCWPSRRHIDWPTVDNIGGEVGGEVDGEILGVGNLSHQGISLYLFQEDSHEKHTNHP